MIEIRLDNPKSGWVCARLSDGGKELLVTASYTPADVMRDFVDAIQSLQTADAADCCWNQEPGELHWKLRRMSEDLEVEILNFPQTRAPGRHLGDPVSVFKAHDSWLSFATQVADSLESIKATMGFEDYERAWRHPFPKEAHEKLRNAIQRRK